MIRTSHLAARVAYRPLRVPRGLVSLQQPWNNNLIDTTTTTLRPCFSTAAATIATPSNLTTQDEEKSLQTSTKPIDFDVAVKIEGEESQVAMIELSPGETLRSESGAMLYMTDGVVMDTKMNGASSAFRRLMTGQNMFLTDYRYEKETGKGIVCLGTAFPSKIMRFSLRDFPDHTLICQKGAYLAASHAEIDIAMEFTKSFTAGFFGGEGFILQRISGPGDILVKGGGTIVRRELTDGETLRVTSGSVVAFSPTIQYDVQMMPGIQNAMFGGEGLFVTTLTGPGPVWLQGMPPDRMIAEIARRVPSGGWGGMPIIIPGGGGGAADGAGGVDATTGGAIDGVAGAGTGDATASTGDAMDSAGASEAAIQADRNATVASSGVSSGEVDAESPSALFGDAVAPETSSTVPEMTDEDSFSDTSFSSTETQQEPSFDDSTTFTNDEFSGGNATDGEIFDDTASSMSESATEESSGVFQTLWDFFTGDN